MRNVLTLAIGVTIAACASVATTVGFPAADADDDNMLSYAEFNEVFDDTDGYERYDDDDNGVLSRTEYNEAVDAQYETDAFFHGLDRNHNGTLTREEFVAGWFNMFDTDKNNYLRRAEFESAIRALEVEL